MNALDNDLHTPIFRAAGRGFAEMTSVLIQAGAEVKIKDKDGRSPLHWAALYGNLPVLSMLLASGAETDATDLSGKTSLMCSA